jgi:hypothetical protein
MPYSDTLPMGSMRLVAMITLVWMLLPTAAAAQEDVASAITDTPAEGFVLLVSDRVDLSTIDPEQRSQISDAWIKSFSDGVTSLSIVATQFADQDGLRAGLSGAMSQILMEDRRLHSEHSGVVLGPITQNDLAAEFAVYGEGSISFAIAAVGPGSVAALEEALDNQITNSIGERFDLRVDENERFLDDQEAPSLTSRMIRVGAVTVLIGIVVYFAQRLVRRRKVAAG